MLKNYRQVFKSSIAYSSNTDFGIIIFELISNFRDLNKLSYNNILSR